MKSFLRTRPRRAQTVLEPVKGSAGIAKRIQFHGPLHASTPGCSRALELNSPIATANLAPQECVYVIGQRPSTILLPEPSSVKLRRVSHFGRHRLADAACKTGDMDLRQTAIEADPNSELPNLSGCPKLVVADGRDHLGAAHIHRLLRRPPAAMVNATAALRQQPFVGR